MTRKWCTIIWNHLVRDSKIWNKCRSFSIVLLMTSTLRTSCLLWHIALTTPLIRVGGMLVIGLTLKIHSTGHRCKKVIHSREWIQVHLWYFINGHVIITRNSNISVILKYWNDLCAQSANSTLSSTPIDSSLSSSLCTFERSANGTSCGKQSWSGSLFYYDPARYGFDMWYLVHSEKCQSILKWVLLTLPSRTWFIMFKSCFNFINQSLLSRLGPPDSTILMVISLHSLMVHHHFTSSIDFNRISGICPPIYSCCM